MHMHIIVHLHNDFRKSLSVSDVLHQSVVRKYPRRNQRRDGVSNEGLSVSHCVLYMRS